MQKSTLFATIILAVILLSTVITVATAQQTPSDQTGNTLDNSFTAVVIGAGSAIFTAGLIGVLFFRKQD